MIPLGSLAVYMFTVNLPKSIIHGTYTRTDIFGIKETMQQFSPARQEKLTLQTQDYMSIL